MRRAGDGRLVASSAFRAVRGRQPDQGELDAMLTLGKKTDFASLLEWIYDSDEADDTVLTRAPAAQDRRIRREMAALDPAGLAAPRLAFLHIMKVAGTSLSHLLEQWAGPGRARVHVYLDDLVLMSRLQLSAATVITGHIPYEGLGLLPPAFQSLVVLRDPVERTLSHYRELRRSRPQYSDLALDEFLHSDVYDVPSGNYQARQLAHTVGVADAWITYSPGQRDQAVGGSPAEAYPLQSLFDSTPVALGDDELLERAAGNLGRIDFVGVTEDLDALAARIGSRFGATDTAVPRLRVSPPSEGGDITAAQRRRIESRTEVDRELHQLARRLAVR